MNALRDSPSGSRREGLCRVDAHRCATAVGRLRRCWVGWCLCLLCGVQAIWASPVEVTADAHADCPVLVIVLPFAPPCLLLKGHGLPTPRDALVAALNAQVQGRTTSATTLRILFR